MMNARLEELVNLFLRKRRNIAIESGIKIYDKRYNEVAYMSILMSEEIDKVVIGYKLSELSTIIEKFVKPSQELDGYNVAYTTRLVAKSIASYLDKIYSFSIFRIETNINEGRIISEYVYVVFDKKRDIILE